MSEHREDDEPEMLDPDEALEEFEDGEGDVAMDSDEGGEDREEIILQNDSIAYFDQHKDSVFAIAQHPVYQSLVATGGSEGDADDAPGKGYVFDISAIPDRPVLPASFRADGTPPQSTELQPLFSLDGHTDSTNALAFTLPRGDFLVSGGMDGRMRVYGVRAPSADGSSPARFAFLVEAQEVPEINWLAPCPGANQQPNTIALGASDGSVWVYIIDPSDRANPLRIVQSYFMHTGPCTAGAWTPDGSLLATVSEDSSLYVWDVWGLAAAKGLAGEGGMTVVSLTAADQRFQVDGGLYSVAVEPRGTFLAVGGAGGAIKIVGLPRLSGGTTAPVAQQASKSSKARAGKASAATGGSGSGSDSNQAGVIMASLHAQSDGIETLAFAPLPQTLLASGSVDGSITVFDTARSFAVRRSIPGAHEDYSVVKVEFVRGAGHSGTSGGSNQAPSAPSAAAAGPSSAGGWLLTSCGMDGVVRRWDLRGATPTQHLPGAAAAGLVREWRGHRGEGEGGGVLGFVQGDSGERIVTAGDDDVVLVFEA